MAVVFTQTTLLSIISPVVAKKYELRVPRNGTSRSGLNLSHVHAVTDVDQNRERWKRTEAVDVCGQKTQQSTIY